MKAIQIVIELEVLVRLAYLPIALGIDAVLQSSEVQHGQVEARAVPRHEIRAVALEAVEEALHELAFPRLLVAEAEHVQAVAALQQRRYRDHAL